MKASDQFGARFLAAKAFFFVKDIGYAHDWSQIISLLSLWLCASETTDIFVAQANNYLLSVLEPCAGTVGQMLAAWSDISQAPEK